MPRLRAAAAWLPPASRSASSTLERLARYLLRPPLAKARLEERPDGQGADEEPVAAPV